MRSLELLLTLVSSVWWTQESAFVHPAGDGGGGGGGGGGIETWNHTSPCAHQHPENSAVGQASIKYNDAGIHERNLPG